MKKKINRQNLKQLLLIHANSGLINFSEKALLESIASEINLNIKRKILANCTINYKTIAQRVKKTLAQAKEAVPTLIKKNYLISKTNPSDKRKLILDFTNGFKDQLNSFATSNAMQLQFLNTNISDYILINNLQTSKEIDKIFYKKRNLVKKDANLTSKQKCVVLTLLYYIKKYKGSVHTNLRFLASKTKVSTATVKRAIERSSKYLQFNLQNNKILVKQSSYFRKIDLANIHNFQNEVFLKNKDYINQKNSNKTSFNLKNEHISNQNYIKNQTKTFKKTQVLKDNLLTKKKQNNTNISKQNPTNFFTETIFDKSSQQASYSINSYSNKNNLAISNKQKANAFFNKDSKFDILNQKEIQHKTENTVFKNNSSKATVCFNFKKVKNKESKKNKNIKTSKTNFNLNKSLTIQINLAIKNGLHRKLIKNSLDKQNKENIEKCLKQFNYSIQNQKINNKNAFFNYLISNSENGLVGFDKAVFYYSETQIKKRQKDKLTAQLIKKQMQEEKMKELERQRLMEKEKMENQLLKQTNPELYKKKQEKEIADNNKLFDNLGFDPKMKEIMSRFYQGVSG